MRDRLEGGAIHVGGGAFLHPAGEVANAQPFHAGGGIEIETAGDAGNVAGVGTVDRLQHQHGVFDAASHGAELVERPAEGHRAGARHAAVGGPQSGDAAAHGGTDDAASGLTADREGHQAGGSGGSGTGAGAGRAFFQQPRVHGLAAEPDVVERQRAHAQFGDEHGAGLMQAVDHGGVLGRHAIAVWLGAVGGRDAGGIDQIFGAPRDAVQRTAILAGSDLQVRLFGLRQGQVAGERDHAAQLGVEALDAVQIDAREALGGEFARLDPVRELRHRREGKVLIGGRQRVRGGFGTDESIACRHPGCLAG